MYQGDCGYPQRSTLQICRRPQMDNLVSRRDVLGSSPSKRKQRKASRLSNAAARLRRKIRSKTVRRMIRWSHYKFKQRLLASSEVNGNKVIIQNEAYTSKTCSWRGNLQNIRDISKCRRCLSKMDRDENGARGIFIRAVLDGHITVSWSGSSPSERAFVWWAHRVDCKVQEVVDDQYCRLL